MLSPHGTRVVQKIIEKLKNEGLIQQFIEIFKVNILQILKDINGNHTVQKFILVINNENFDFLSEILVNNVTNVTNHKYGCCVLQKFLSKSKDIHKVITL